MSSLASWSYTRTATHWPISGRDDWTGALTFGAPVTFSCDYSAESKRMTDSKGIEFTTRQVIHTEKSDIVQGDFVVIGASTDTNPHSAGAHEVRAVTRYSDTFEQLADDYMVAT